MCHFFIWVELVLLLVLFVGINIVIKRLDDLGNAVSQSVVLIKDPSILIWQLPLVIRVNFFRSILWSDCGFQKHLGVGLEKVWKQLLLDLVDFLQRLDSVVEDGQDGNHNFLGFGAVAWSAIVTGGEVNVEERKLVLRCSHLSDLLLGIVDVLNLT